MSSTLITSKQNKISSKDQNQAIWAETKWWGFTIHLDEATTQKLETFDDYLAAVIGAALQAFPELEPVTAAIVASMKIRNLIIKDVDKGEGVKLISPWITPTLLIPFAESDSIDDGQLRWTTTDGVNGWVSEIKLKQEFSEASPALAAYQGKLYMAYRGVQADTHISWTAFDGTTVADGEKGATGTWSNEQGVGDWAQTVLSPALAAFQGKLYMAYRLGGEYDDHRIQVDVFDGNNWSPLGTIPGATTWFSPALAEFNGKLYCVYRDNSTNDYLWWTAFDGNSWSQNLGVLTDQTYPVKSSSAPALVVCEGKLICVYKGDGQTDTQMFWVSCDANGNWSDHSDLHGIKSVDRPSMAVFNDNLYCVFLGGDGKEGLWYTTYQNGNWSGITTGLDGCHSAKPPAICVYRDPMHGQQDQLLCVHRGVEY